MKDLSRIRQRAGKLMRERYRLEKQNLAMRDMIKGSLIKHYKKCGSKVCVCREGRLHGPYWYLSYKEGEKSVLKYVDVRDLTKISHLAGNYKKFQSNITRINKMNREIGKLMGDMREVLTSRHRRK
jgi:hypothetical protein